MGQATYVFFDLDGTLTDSRPGIFHSFRYALEKFGRTAEDAELQPCLGPPLAESFMGQFGFSPEQAETAIRYYREYFNPRGMMENAVYPGIPQALAALRAAGKRLMVATSKPEEFARQILAHFELDSYFEIIAGATMDEARNAKEDVLRYLLAQIPDAAEAVKSGSVLMVGDRKYDVLGAREVGIPCLGVRYGYGAPGELEKAGAAAIADSVSGMRDFILNGYSA